MCLMKMLKTQRWKYLIKFDRFNKIMRNKNYANMILWNTILRHLNLLIIYIIPIIWVMYENIIQLQNDMIILIEL